MRRHSNRSLFLAFLGVLLLSLTLSSCGTLDVTNPTPGGQPAAQTLTVNDAMRTVERELLLAAADVDDLCQRGTLGPDKCSIAQQAIAAAGDAHDKVVKDLNAGVPVTVAAVLAITKTLEEKLRAGQVPVSVPHGVN